MLGFEAQHDVSGSPAASPCPLPLVVPKMMCGPRARATALDSRLSGIGVTALLRKPLLGRCSRAGILWGLNDLQLQDGWEPLF